MAKQNRVMPHPVWVKKGAVNPRNQKNKLTHEDKIRFYGLNARVAGESIVDLKNEWIKWQEFVALFAKR